MDIVPFGYSGFPLSIWKLQYVSRWISKIISSKKERRLRKTGVFCTSKEKYFLYIRGKSIGKKIILCYTTCDLIYQGSLYL